MAEKAKLMIEAAKTLGGEDARYILLNVIDEIPVWATRFMPVDVMAKPRKSIQEKLTAIAKDNNIEAEIQVRPGHSYNTILEVAEESRTDLIIVASHHPGYVDYFPGSTAAKVVRHAKCSVFIIR